jgi:hypothetical protein
MMERKGKGKGRRGGFCKGFFVSVGCGGLGGITWGSGIIKVILI